MLFILFEGCSLAPYSGGVSGRPCGAEALAGAAARELEAKHGGVLCDDALSARIEAAMRCVYARNPKLAGDYTVAVLDDGEVNAFSLPPGRIYVTRGLCARVHDDAQWRAIICHEIAHLEARDHYAPPCANDAEALAREIKADCRAATYLHNAQLTAHTICDVVELIRDVQPHGWADQRIQAVAARTPSAHRPKARLASAPGG
jgi:hypothetical protein